ncbi:MAG: hypothetical protein F6K28_21085 [Microcoleus sp. SIO2G3]|nr:hypothetical protein [Microcoleus sp. SIO2G3]
MDAPNQWSLFSTKCSQKTVWTFSIFNLNLEQLEDSDRYRQWKCDRVACNLETYGSLRLFQA